MPYPQVEITTLIPAIMMNEPSPLPDYVPQPVKTVLARALSKNPATRYKTAAEMRGDLRKVLRGDQQIFTPQQSIATEQKTIVRPVAPPLFIKKPQKSNNSTTESFFVEPIVAFNLARTYQAACNDADLLYESTRKSWFVNISEAKNARYAFATYHGEIKEVYEISDWQPALEARNKGRYEFTGRIADEEIRKNTLAKEYQTLRNVGWYVSLTAEL